MLYLYLHQSLFIFLNKCLSTGIAVHVPKPDCKFKQNDKKENIYGTCVLVFNYLVFQVRRMVRDTVYRLPIHTSFLLITSQDDRNIYKLG